jgi:hypothetical protein
MTGGALRGGALAIAVCGIAAAASAAGLDVTDGDRVWANFTREAAVVGDKHFWVELRGMSLMDDQGIKQNDSQGTTFDGPTLGFNGYPVNKPTCTVGSTSQPCVDQITGGRFELVGAYGLTANAEVGIDLPFVMQEKISFAQAPSENHTGIGDMVLYGKFKKELAEHWAGALGLEISTATGSESRFLGAGATGLNPFLSTRYESGRVALGAHVGFLLNTDSQPDVFNWDVDGIVRGSPLFALRCEVNGRQFRNFGETFTDIAVWPGLDVNLTDYFIIRPQAEAHLTNDALNWGLGIAFVFTM